MRINTNVNAMIATNQMSKNTALSGASMEKLSTGLRITKAGDDATGLAISEKMRSQIRGMEQAERNVQDGISMVQTAEGAMEEIGNITQRMRELAVQASNETNSAVDREKITTELKQLNSEIDRISESTTFNGEQILAGGGMISDAAGRATDISAHDGIKNLKISSSKFEDVKYLSLESGAAKELTAKLYDSAGKVVETQTLTFADDNYKGEVNFDELGIKFDLDASTNGVNNDFGTAKNESLKLATENGRKEVGIQAGANNENSNSLTVTVEAMTTVSLGLSDEDDINNIASKDIATGTQAAKDFITTLDKALETVNTARATLGAQQNRLEYTSSNLTSSTENLSAAESRIRDVDVAKEMVKLSKLNILNQASQAMVSQAKQQPESVSQLLR